MEQYRVVSEITRSEDQDECLFYGVACGNVVLKDLSAQREAVERLVAALNDCLLPVELLKEVVINWLSKREE